MNELEAIKARHSVRAYKSTPIPEDVRKQLEAAIEAGNAEGNLHMKLVCDEPEAFDSTMAHYGKFSGVRNYVVIAGPTTAGLEERGGYYGERVALLAQQLGLNGCWVALTFKRRYVKAHLQTGDKLVVVITLGYGETQGIERKTKAAADLIKGSEGAPEWFSAGVNAAMLAPTAMNQQKFTFELLGSTSEAGSTGNKPQVKLTNLGGAYSKVDLGIVKYHFEVGAGTSNFTWA